MKMIFQTGNCGDYIT